MEYKTGFLRALVAMLCGVLIGGNLSMGLMITVFGPPAPDQAMQIWLIMQAYWLAGVLVFAVVPFVLLHISNLRQWYGMTAIGIMTMVSLSLYIFKGVGEGAGFFVLAAIGGIVGWVIWRVAYRRVPLAEGPV